MEAYRAQLIETAICVGGFLFQHPIKIGDTIKVLDEANPIEGELIDITYFFVFIRTRAGGTVTMPNSLLLRSSFVILNDLADREP